MADASCPGRAGEARRFPDLAEALLREGTVDHAEALWNCINTFRDWQITDPWGVRFMHDSEWTWRSGRTSLADW